jgi:hypothetical protein
VAIVPDLTENLRVLSREKAVVPVSLATSTPRRRLWRYGAQLRSDEHATVAPKLVVAQASTLHGDSEAQDREGGGAPSRAGHGEPMRGGAPVSSVTAVMHFRALPEPGWRCWCVEVVERGKA